MSHVSNFELFEARRPKQPEMFPSEDFGKATGMDWIYKDWELPLTADQAAEKIFKWSDDLDVKSKAEKAGSEIIDFYRGLVEKNPELKELGEPKSWLNVIDFCQGAISKFNTDDIKFYANLEWNDRVRYNMSNRSLMDEIQKKAKCPTSWVMSPTTIARVKKELKMK